MADDARTGRAREDVRVTEDGRAGRQPGDVPFRRPADSGEPWPRRAERPLVQEPAPPRRTANGSGVNGGTGGAPAGRNGVANGSGRSGDAPAPREPW
ncbi:hypothetical protein, partial [Pseudonocardia sp. NPDC049154]|uniref:hypothetical protein n=1 Tax=Pseudonocardia sp. NPDC049154 TaxID=3155501 RepID=UPI0033CF7ED4